MAAEERWVGVDDMAAHLGVAKDSIYRWIEKWGLPAHRVGRLFRFKLSEIDNWVRQDNEREKTPSSVQSRLSSKARTKRSIPKDQLDQLRERKRTEQAAAESCFRELYTAAWLPRLQDGELEIEKVERGGRPLQATGVHERIMELLTSVGTPRIHGSVTPLKIAERVRLSESLVDGEAPLMGIKASDVLESFFRDIAPPRLESASVLRKGIARGVSESVFAYASGGSPDLGPDGRYQVNRDKVILGRSIADDEVDFDSGFLMMPAAVPEAPAAQPTDAFPVDTGAVSPPSVHEGPAGIGVETGTGSVTTSSEVAGRKKRVALTFEATREQVFKAFPAIANLADKSDGAKVRIRIEGSSAAGFDPS